MRKGKFYTDPAGKWYHRLRRRFWFDKITGPYDTFDELWHVLRHGGTLGPMPE